MKLLGSAVRSAVVVVLSFALLFVAFLLTRPIHNALLEAGTWALVYSGLTIGAFLWLQVTVDKQAATWAGLRAPFFRPLGAGIAWALVLFGFILFVEIAIGRVTFVGISASQTGQLGVVKFLMQGALMCWGIAVGEEVAARGYLLQYLSSRHGWLGGSILSALVFSLMHAGDGARSVWEMGNILLIALFLTVLYLKQGSLWAPIGMHWAWNLLEMYVAPVSDVSEPGLLQFKASLGIQAGPGQGFVSSLVFVAVTAFLTIRWLESGTPFSPANIREGLRSVGSRKSSKAR